MAFPNKKVAELLRDICRHVGNNILMRQRTEILNRRNPYSTFGKQSHGLVTDTVTKADIQSEEYIVRKMLELDQDLTVIGEESGRRINNEQPYLDAIILDPLDGSDSFARTLDGLIESPEYREYRNVHRIRHQDDDFNKYTVHVMYVVGDEIRVAVTYSPERKIITIAIKDKGAYMLNEATKEHFRLDASRKQIFSSSVIADSYLPPKLTPEYKARFSPVLEALAEINTNYRRFGYTSSVYEALSTLFPDNHPDARALYIGSHVYLWDVPILTLREAGGDALTIQEQDGMFRIAPFSLKDFKIYDPNSEAYKEPFFVIVGEKEMLGRLGTKILGHLPRLER